MLRVSCCICASLGSKAKQRTVTASGNDLHGQHVSAINLEACLPHTAEEMPMLAPPMSTEYKLHAVCFA